MRCLLQINEAYRLDVFIAERFRCKSHILFQSSGVSFLLDDARPVDYFAVISEDAHVGSIVQVGSLADKCSCDSSNENVASFVDILMTKGTSV